MSRIPFLWTVSVLSIGLILGCGSPKSAEVVGGGDPTPGKPGDPSKPPPPTEAAPPKDGVFRTPAELFAAMPKDAYPKGGKDGTLERDAANEWAKKNLVGKQIEWKAKITDVIIEKGERGYSVVLGNDLTHVWQEPNWIDYGVVWGKPVSIGSETIVVGHTYDRKGYVYSELMYDPVDAATAKELRAFKDKTVVFRGTIQEGAFTFERLTVGPRLGKGQPFSMVFTIKYSAPSIDGYVAPLLK